MSATDIELNGKRAMHVAFWSPAWPLEKHPNGIITYVTEVKRELEKRGHRVSVFTAFMDESLNDDRVFRIESPKWTRFVRRLFRSSGQASVFGLSSAISKAILREHRRNPIDVVEMEESFGWCADVQRATSLPMVVKLHGPAFLTSMERGHDANRIEREGWALARCRTIVSPSAANLRLTVERYGLVGKNARVIVNPVRIDERSPVWSLSACERQTILFVGRFDLVKGADVLLKAFVSVLNHFPNARLVFVGPDSGWDAPGGGKVQFASYCDAELPPAARRRVEYRGRLPHGEVAALRALSMVTVVASRWESQSYAMLEAMAQGCPVVATDAGACPEGMVNGKTGLLARSEDPEDFARQVCAILREPEIAAAMGRAAREHVIQHYSGSRVVPMMLDCYQNEISAYRSVKGRCK